MRETGEGTVPCEFATIRTRRKVTNRRQVPLLCLPSYKLIPLGP